MKLVRDKTGKVFKLPNLIDRMDMLNVSIRNNEIINDEHNNMFIIF